MQHFHDTGFTKVSKSLSDIQGHQTETTWFDKEHTVSY